MYYLLCFVGGAQLLFADAQEANEVILEPLIHLLSSKDAEVLRAASLALSSLALYGAGNVPLVMF